MRKLKILLALTLILCMMPVMAAAIEETEVPTDVADDAVTDGLDVPLGDESDESDTVDIAVYLNGQAVDFVSGVLPWYDGENYRTYVPFRDLFEALGAEVAYDGDTRTITAQRGDTAVTFSQDGTEFHVTQGDDTRTVQSDVTPVTREGRVLVPIRFASEALGANVGWDSDSTSVLIIDAQTLMAGETFGLASKALAQGIEVEHAARFESKFAFDYGMSYQGMDMSTTLFTGYMNMLYDGKNVNYTFALDKLETSEDGQELDMAAMMRMMLAEELGVDMALLEQEQRMIINRETGMAYMNSSLLNSMGQFPEDTWLSINGAEALEELGLPMDQLLEAFDLEALVTQLMAEGFEDMYDYEAMLEVYGQICKLFADSSFVKTDSTYANTVYFGEDDVTITVGIAIEVDEKDQVVGCQVNLALVDDYDEVEMTVTLSWSGHEISVDVNLLMDTMEMAFSIDTVLTSADELPVGAPPEDATIVDLTESNDGLDEADWPIPGTLVGNFVTAS